LKVQGTVKITMGQVIDPEPGAAKAQETEELDFTLEGSADAILTAIQEMKRLGTFGNFNLQ